MGEGAPAFSLIGSNGLKIPSKIAHEIKLYFINPKVVIPVM